MVRASTRTDRQKTSIPDSARPRLGSSGRQVRGHERRNLEMTGQNERSRRPSRADVAAAARIKATTAVDDMVAESAGRTTTQLRSTALTWPGTNTVQPEPVACLESARELERAAHELAERYICLARETGRSWHEIGEALDLHWAAAANKESIADEAYDYALRYQPGTGLRPPHRPTRRLAAKAPRPGVTDPQWRRATSSQHLRGSRTRPLVLTWASTRPARIR